MSKEWVDQLTFFCRFAVSALTLYDAPRVLPGAHHLVADLDELVGADDGEGQVRVHGLVVLGDRLIRRGELVDLDAVVDQLAHDLGLEAAQLGLVHRVSLGDDRDDVHLGKERGNVN